MNLLSIIMGMFRGYDPEVVTDEKDNVIAIRVTIPVNAVENNDYAPYDGDKLAKTGS